MEQLNGNSISGMIEKMLDHELADRGIDWRKYASGDPEMKKKVQSFRNECMRKLGLKEDSDVNQIANLFFSATDVASYTSKRGENIETFIVNLTNKLQIAEQQRDPAEIARNLADAGIVALSSKMAQVVGKALVRGLRTVDAVALGVVELGVVDVAAIIGLLLLCVLLPFLILMEKPAQILAMIFNNTEYDINKVGFGSTNVDYYLEHGKNVSVPYDEDPDTQDNVAIVRNETVLMETIVAAGLFYGSKCEDALYGTSGALWMKFKNGIGDFPNGVFLGYKVPLTGCGGKNGCTVSWNEYDSAKDFYKDDDVEYSIGKKLSDDNRVAQAYIDSQDVGGSANNVYMIALVQQK